MLLTFCAEKWEIHILLMFRFSESKRNDVITMNPSVWVILLVSHLNNHRDIASLL